MRGGEDGTRRGGGAFGYVQRWEDLGLGGLIWVGGLGRHVLLVASGFWLPASGEGRGHGRGAELRVVVACMMGSFV